MRKRNKYKQLIIFLVIVACMLYFTMLRDKHNRSKMKGNPVLINATITGIEQVPRTNGLYVKYAFDHKSGRYVDRGNISVPHQAKQFLDTILVGRKIPLLFEKDNPGRHLLLIRERDLDEFGYARPNELLRVYQIIDSLEGYPVRAATISDALSNFLDTVRISSVSGADTALVLFLYRNYLNYQFADQRKEYAEWILSRDHLLTLFKSLFKQKPDWGTRLKKIDYNAWLFYDRSVSEMMSDFNDYKSVSSFPATEFLFNMRNET
ncbi:MAG: hypothetical protein J7578_07575, partial [Chitinophagaceae bacterium]|nr:hypothetical protein [Chitinophagaceae bacterium]